MQHLISVIIPCYNVEKYLSRCIESVINQQYKNLEIILIDDESPDKSGEICEKYAKQDSRIVVIHQKNKGLSGARNTGIELAKGDYLFFVDSDDLIFPNTIKDLYIKAIENEADLVSAEYIKGKEPLAIIGLDDDTIVGNGAQVLEYVLKNATWSAWGKLYKRELINHDRFLEGYLYEDFEFVPRQYLKSNKCVHCCKKLYFYFDNDSGIMGASKCCLRTYYVDFAINNIQYVMNSSYNAEEKEKVYAGLFLHYMWDYTKPIRVYGEYQSKEFRKTFYAFLHTRIGLILKNKYLETGIKIRYLALYITPQVFDYAYKLSYRIRSKQK